MRKRISPITFFCVLLVLLTGCQQPVAKGANPTPTHAISVTPTASLTSTAAPDPTASPTPPWQLSHAGLPIPEHVVIVMEENHSYSDIIGSAGAPYINQLARQGAVFSQSFAITHPSEPNYLALFSGSTYGLASDACPETFTNANLGSELLASGFTFTGYSENLPAVGSTACSSGEYARKHSPWVNFTDLPGNINQPFTHFPVSTDYSSLPTVSFVIPDLNDDMHDGTIQGGDAWLKKNLGSYVTWMQQNNSLLIITWDEDDGSESNQIPTLFVGPMVKSGTYNETINHYRVLRTVEDMYSLNYLGSSASVPAITDCWSQEL